MESCFNRSLVTWFGSVLCSRIRSETCPLIPHHIYLKLPLPPSSDLKRECVFWVADSGPLLLSLPCLYGWAVSMMWLYHYSRSKRRMCACCVCVYLCPVHNPHRVSRAPITSHLLKKANSFSHGFQTQLIENINKCRMYSILTNRTQYSHTGKKKMQ